MRRTLLFLVLFLGPAGTASASTLHLSPTGSDSAQCTSSAPCQSFARAYSVAASGDVVQVNSGSYPRQEVPAGSKTITFRGVAGNKIRQLISNADNITFDGLDLDAGGTKTTWAVFEHGGARNVTLKNSRVGNVVDEKGAMLGGSSDPSPTNLVIDNVVFHDVVQQTAGVHNECIFNQAPGITIRNSTFINCATMDIAMSRGDWWGQPPYGNVVLENNVFSHSVNGSGWHWYGLAWYIGKFENARVVNNTFENSVQMEDQHVGPGPYSGVWANNIGGGWQCLPGVTYAGNVGQKCGATDKAISPTSSCNPPACNPGYTMPVGWVNPASYDFHLKAGSPAIDAGSPTYAPSSDRDGKSRVGAPDAGAYEFNGTPAPTPPPSPSPSPSPTPSPTASPTPTPTASPTPTPSPGPVPAALVGAWSFDEATGATVKDASGRGNTGTISGATPTAAGKFGGALSFDGSNDFVSIPDSASLDLTKGMTLEAWVKPSATSGYRTAIFKEHRSAGHQAYSLYAATSSARPGAEVSTPTGYTSAISSQSIATGAWSHIAATYDGSTLKVFRDGAEVASKPLTSGFATTGDPLKIGGNAVWSEWFKGVIDEVRVFDAARTGAQIQADMATPVG